MEEKMVTRAHIGRTVRLRVSSGGVHCDMTLKAIRKNEQDVVMADCTDRLGGYPMTFKLDDLVLSYPKW